MDGIELPSPLRAGTLLFQLKDMFQDNAIIRCYVVLIKGVPRSTSKLSIGSFKRHGSHVQKCAGFDKLEPNNRAVSCNWNQTVRHDD